MPALDLPIKAGLLNDFSDIDIFIAGGLKVANNVIPINSRYLPVLDLNTFCNTAVSGTPSTGGTWQSLADSLYYNFISTSTHIYRFTASGLTDKSGATYTGIGWQWEQYGNWLIATNGADNPQVFKDFEGAGAFTDLGGSPPIAKYCLMFNGYLILANLSSDVDLGTDAKGIRWSALEGIENWTTDPAGTGCDYQSFPDAIGTITGIERMGDVLAIFTERSITIGYPSASFIFEFKHNYINSIGCFYPQSLISVGAACFFWGQDSIYMIDSSLQVTDIAKDKIKRNLFTDINITLDTSIYVVHDKTNSLIMWSYASTSAVSGFDRILCYNYDTNTFTKINLTGYTLMTGATGGISIDQLTTLSIDEINSTIDSNYWLNRALQPMIVDTDDSKIKTLTGDALTIELHTGEFQDSPKYVTIINAYTPAENVTGSLNITPYGRYSSADAFAVGTTSTFKSNGMADIRYSNKRIAFNLQGSGFTAINNQLKIEVQERGNR